MSDQALHQVFCTDADDEEEGGWVEALLPYSNFVIQGSPADAFRVAIALCGAVPDDHTLCRLGVVVIEPLLDLHWKTIGDAFEVEAKRNPAARKAISETTSDGHPPPNAGCVAKVAPVRIGRRAPNYRPGPDGDRREEPPLLLDRAGRDEGGRVKRRIYPTALERTGPT